MYPSQLTQQTKTLSTSRDEDDWDTDTTPGVPEKSVRNSLPPKPNRPSYNEIENSISIVAGSMAPQNSMDLAVSTAGHSESSSGFSRQFFTTQTIKKSVRNSLPPKPNRPSYNEIENSISIVAGSMAPQNSMNLAVSSAGHSESSSGFSPAPSWLDGPQNSMDLAVSSVGHSESSSSFSRQFFTTQTIKKSVRNSLPPKPNRPSYNEIENSISIVAGSMAPQNSMNLAVSSAGHSESSYGFSRTPSGGPQNSISVHAGVAAPQNSMNSAVSSAGHSESSSGFSRTPSGGPQNSISVHAGVAAPQNSMNSAVSSAGHSESSSGFSPAPSWLDAPQNSMYSNTSQYEPSFHSSGRASGVGDLSFSVAENSTGIRSSGRSSLRNASDWKSKENSIGFSHAPSGLNGPQNSMYSNTSQYEPSFHSSGRASGVGDLSFSVAENESSVSSVPVYAPYNSTNSLTGSFTGNNRQSVTDLQKEFNNVFNEQDKWAKTGSGSGSSYVSKGSISTTGPSFSANGLLSPKEFDYIPSISSNGDLFGPGTAKKSHTRKSVSEYFSKDEVEVFQKEFMLYEDQGRVGVSNLVAIATKATISPQDLVEKITQMSLHESGLVTFDQFLKAATAVKKESSFGLKNDRKIVLGGHNEGITHTINVDEKESFTVHINQALQADKHLSSRLPVDPSSMQIFSECKDGLILAKLINVSVNGTIDERVLNMKPKMNTFQMTENNNVVVNSAKAIGCHVVNIGSSDLLEGREHLILGLIWQIIKIGLQSNIDIKKHPELFRLLYKDEILESFLKLPAEAILLRWVNYHLKQANHPKEIVNFTSDIKDSVVYTLLMNQLAKQCDLHPIRENDLILRAELTLQNADKLGCRKYLNPKTLCEGNQKLNFAFVANLFNTHPGLEKLSEQEMAGLDSELFDSEGTHEARTFSLWMNSLGVDPFVRILFDDLQSGIILLQTLDKVKPGLVNWRKTNTGNQSKFKQIENLNYVLLLGKDLGFHLVNIQGSDIFDGNKKLTLGFCWQLMREHVIQTLGGVEDKDIVDWANQKCKSHQKSSRITSFKDEFLGSSLFLLDLLDAIKPGVVDYSLVSGSHDGLKLNAQYAISIARKLGATIFCMPEDIVEVKAKMIMTFVGTLMALAGGK